MITTDLFSRTGRRVVDMRQPQPTAFASQQLDHSYLPTQLTATTAQVTPGMVYDRYGVGRSITTATNWPVDGIIDFSSPNKCFYVQIKYLSSPVASAGTFDEMLWVPAASFPSYRASLFTVNIPILEFPDNTWGGMIRRQIGNAYEGAYRHNDLGGPMQGGDAALDEFYHLTEAQVDLIDDLPYVPPHPPQDPDQPWPGDEYPIQDPDVPWPTPGDHATLSDVVSQNVGDDHRGGRAAGSEVIIVVDETAVYGHPYIHANGNETRNAMMSGAYIGDAFNAKSIWPSGRQLMNGATVVVDWILRKLSGGAWTVTDTTAATGTAGTTAGALVVDGGVNIKDNLIVQDTTAAGDNTGSVVAKGGVFAANGIFATNGTASVAGHFVDTGVTYTAQLGTPTEAALLTDLTNFVHLCNGTYSVNASAGRINSVDGYAANGVDGWSGTFQVTQGGVTKGVTVSGGIITGVA